MVKVAIIGLGFMGKVHLGVYQNLANVEVTSLCDAANEAFENQRPHTGENIQSASGKGRITGIRTYTSYENMFAEGGFDVVDICLPTYLHAECIVKALEADYHVFCEKPIALDLEEIEKILEKVKESGKLFSVGQCLRYWPAYVEVKRMIDEEKYGRVRYAEFTRFSTAPGWTRNNWILDSRNSGNAAIDLHIHDVDMILYLFGLPASLRSVGIVEDDGSISLISTVYKYDELVVASTGGWLCSTTYGFNMKAFYILETATVEIDFLKDPMITVFPEDREKYSPQLPEWDGYYYELKDFIEGIENGKLSGIVTPESASAAVKLCLEEIRSVKENREIGIRCC
jgi:predicted dehydrogenase